MLCPDICSPTRARAGPRHPTRSLSRSSSLARHPSQMRKPRLVPRPASLLPPAPTTATTSARPLSTHQVPRKKTHIARVKSTLKQRRCEFRSWYERELLDLAVKHLDWVPAKSVEGVLYHVPLVPGKHSRESLIQVLDGAVETLSSSSSSISKLSASTLGVSGGMGRTRERLDLLDETVFDPSDYDGLVGGYAPLEPDVLSVVPPIVIEASPLQSPGLPPAEVNTEDMLINLEFPENVSSDCEVKPCNGPSVDEMFFGEPASAPLPPKVIPAPEPNIKGSPPPRSPLVEVQPQADLVPKPLRLSKKPENVVAPAQAVPTVPSPRTATENGRRVITKRHAHSDLHKHAGCLDCVTQPNPPSSTAPLTAPSGSNKEIPVERKTTIARKPVPQPIQVYQPFRLSPGKRQALEFVPYRPTGKRGPLLPTIPPVNRKSLFDEMNLELDNALGFPSRPSSFAEPSQPGSQELARIAEHDEGETDDIPDLPSPTPNRPQATNLPYLPYSKSLHAKDCVEPIGAGHAQRYQPFIPPRSTSLTTGSMPLNAELSVEPPLSPIAEANEAGAAEAEVPEVSDSMHQRVRNATVEALARTQSEASEDFGWKRWVDKEYEDPAVSYSKQQREKLRKEKKRKQEHVLVEF